ncbi:MAG: metallopeptidase TldD-related protein [Candidatus Hodarchaeales archaeon]|jgi:PmbA protein
MVLKNCQDKDLLAQEALAIARKQRIDNIEIFIQCMDVLQFAAGSAVRITGRTFFEQGAAIRVAVNGRLGFACGTVDTNLETLIKNADKQARAQFLGTRNHEKSFPAGKEIRQKESSSSDIVSLTIEDLKTIANEMMESTELDQLAKIVESTATRNIEERLIVNSEGLFRESVCGWITASCQAIVRRPTGEMGFGFNSVRTRDIESFDPISVGSRAYATAMLLSNARNVPKRDQDRIRRTRRILWHPMALAQLLAHILVPTIVKRSQKPFKMQEENQADTLPFPTTFEVLDDPTKRDLIPTYAFDDEGTNTKKKTLISDGKLTRKLSEYDSDPQANGGNSYRVQYFSERFRSFRYSPTLSPVNLFLNYTKSGHSTDLVDLCTGATIMVHRLVGAHVASPTTGDFSVDATEGYLVRNRQVRFPIRKMSIAGNIYHLLKAVRAVGTMETVQPLPSPFTINCPFILTEKSGTSLFPE